jgi:hypothetical protein
MQIVLSTLASLICKAVALYDFFLAYASALKVEKLQAL